MTRSRGYIQITGPGNRRTNTTDPGQMALQACGEADTYTCGHCQAVVIVPPGRNDDGVCFTCGRLVCKHCVKDGQCRPFEEEIERNLTAQAWRTQV